MKEEIASCEAACLECGKKFLQSGNIQLCKDCVDKFDLEALWNLHDTSQLDALDFNESKTLRERFRIIKNKGEAIPKDF